jgi:arabinoxylan arabinofuranohydrolase
MQFKTITMNLTIGMMVLFFSQAYARAGNPIVSFGGLDDVHGVVYGDRVYLYACHDDSFEHRRFVLKYWWCWSSEDLVNWRQECILKPEDTFLKRPFNDCWATFGATRNGKYYWYFSAGPKEIGVVEGDTPAGPWRDPLGKPLIAAGSVPTEARDPDIMMDDGGEAYIVFGTFDYFMARLNTNMISLAEAPRKITIHNPEGPYGKGKTDDKPSLHKRNGIYYLSWSSFYAMSTNVYGPYTYKGSVITPEGVAPEFCKGDIYHDRHGNFFTWRHQWYYTCNDFSQPGRKKFFRDACISYVHYRDNGEMAPIRLDRIGVGQYDASQPRIEAEDYFDAEGVEQRESPEGGFEVRGLRSGSRLVYPNVTNLQARVRMAFRVASVNPGGVKLEVRHGGPGGKRIADCAIPSTGGWDRYQTVECDVELGVQKANLCLMPTGGTNELLRLDWFSLNAR